MTSTTTPRIAIVGYGSQGRAHALNLRDSGFDVTIGLRPGGPTELKAKADGFTVKTPAEAVRHAELVAVLTPDMELAGLRGELAAALERAQAILNRFEDPTGHGGRPLVDDIGVPPEWAATQIAACNDMVGTLALYRALGERLRASDS